jgi:hypothetical protein
MGADVLGIAVQKQNGSQRPARRGQKPAIQARAVAGVEIHVLVFQPQLLGRLDMRVIGKEKTLLQPLRPSQSDARISRCRIRNKNTARAVRCSSSRGIPVQRGPGAYMKKIIVASVLILSGCSNIYLDTIDLLRAQNTGNLAKLTVGLRKETAMEMMGTEASKGVFMWIDNPYRSETLMGKDGKNYEVLHYYTDLKQRDDRITDDELTPLVFHDGKLIGWGYLFLDQRVPPKPVYTR